ncbi:MAG: outer membrane beta-barrel protein [Candidatus Binatia bacterium]
MRTSNWRSNVVVAAALVCAAGAGSAQAEEAEAKGGLAGAMEPVYSVLSNDDEGYDLSDSILGPDSAYDFGGWLAVGYNSNKTGLFNSHNNVNMTQLWLYTAKSMDTSEGFDWGFRFDAMFGTDGADTQAFGSTPGKWDFQNGLDDGKYGAAFPQLYAEVGYKDISIKAGHFYTPVGYEVVTAPDNFFYSHAFTMYLSEPFTHTGFLATYSGIEGVDIFGGWSAGWDTGFDQYNDGSNFLGGVALTPADWAKVTYTMTAGDLGWIGSGYSHSLVADVNVTEKLNWVFQSDYVDVDEQGANYETIGVNQYLIYALTEKIGLGTRVEWWRGNNTDYYALTAGINFKVLPNLMLRPEFRYQWSPEVEDDPTVNTAGVPVDQGAFAFDAIFTF